MGAQLTETGPPHGEADWSGRLCKEVQRLQRRGVQPVVVLDGYQFSVRHHVAVREAGARLVVIDDNGLSSLSHADLVVNPNIFGDTIPYQPGPQTKLAVGSDYVLLRRSFLKRGRHHQEREGTEWHVLVTMGGGDTNEPLHRVLRALEHCETKLRVTVVTGANNEGGQALRRAVDRSRHRIRLLHDVDDMAAVMSGADLAIAAAGGTASELAYLGVPSLLLTTADNQCRAAQAFDTAGAAISLGSYRDAGPDSIAAAVTDLLRSPAVRHAMGQRGRRLIDGRGTHRVCEAIRRECARH